MGAYARAMTNNNTTAPALHHLPKVTYHRPTDSYRAACPHCDWATEPSLNTTALHEASSAHQASA